MFQTSVTSITNQLGVARFYINFVSGASGKYRLTFSVGDQKSKPSDAFNVVNPLGSIVWKTPMHNMAKTGAFSSFPAKMALSLEAQMLEKDGVTPYRGAVIIEADVIEEGQGRDFDLKGVFKDVGKRLKSSSFMNRLGRNLRCDLTRVFVDCRSSALYTSAWAKLAANAAGQANLQLVLEEAVTMFARDLVRDAGTNLSTAAPLSTTVVAPIAGLSPIAGELPPTLPLT